MKFTPKKSGEFITFLSRQPIFSGRFSLCDSSNDTRISMKTNWRKRVRVESAHKRSFNTLASSRWHIKRSFRYSSAATAGKQQGSTGMQLERGIAAQNERRLEITLVFGTL
jgi:hypothetical protein